MPPKKKKTTRGRPKKKASPKKGAFEIDYDFIQKTHDLSLYAQAFNLILILFFLPFVIFQYCLRVHGLQKLISSLKFF